MAQLGSNEVNIATVIISSMTAILSGVIVAFVNNKYNSKARQTAFLMDQLRNLYGPLQYHTSISNINIILKNSLDDAGKKVHGDWLTELQDLMTQTPTTPEESEKVREKLGDLLNKKSLAFGLLDYMNSVVEANFKMAEILEQNYCYIDPEDMEVFNDFLAFCRQWKNEHTEDGDLKLDESIQIENNWEFVNHPAMAQMVEEKFLAKQKRLRQLGK